MKNILYAWLIFLGACNITPKYDYILSNEILLDSLMVEDVGSLSEFMYMQLVNDTTIRSYNVEDCSINFYKRNPKKDKRYKHSRTILELPTRGYLPLMFKHKNYYYQGTEIGQKLRGTIYKYDTLYRLVKAMRLDYKFNYLDKNFVLVNDVTSPLISVGDTIISAYYHNDVTYIPEYYKENSVAEFVFKDDSLIAAKTYISKPKGLHKYELKPVSYCYNNNEILAIYPMMDSIYSYNRITKKERHFAIGNKDFIKPHLFEEEEGDDYFKKLTNYELENFRYGSIFFNPITKHYIIFYYLPLNIKEGNKQLTFRDQKEHALVLNEKFEVLKYIKFGQKYFNQANYFFVPGKGIAMPLFKSKSDYENIKYYVYNF